MNDPYSEMIALFRADQPALGFRFGTVLSAEPLTIEVAGLTVTDIWCNEALLERPREAEAVLNGEASSGTVTLKKALQAGDRVLLLSDEDQMFYILCKVVSV